MSHLSEGNYRQRPAIRRVSGTVDCTKVAEVHHNHYGSYKKLRSTSKSPDPLKYPEAMKCQKVHFRGRVPMQFQKAL